MNAAAVSVSAVFNDNQTRKRFEANTIDTEKRIEALRKLKESGVRTGALLCPVMPYITDTVQMIDRLEPYADVIWIYGLNINDRSDQNWINIQKILNRQFPDLSEQIETVIFSKDHGFWAALRKNLENLKKIEN